MRMTTTRRIEAPRRDSLSARLSSRGLACPADHSREVLALSAPPRDLIDNEGTQGRRDPTRVVSVWRAVWWWVLELDHRTLDQTLRIGVTPSTASDLRNPLALALAPSTRHNLRLHLVLIFPLHQPTKRSDRLILHSSPRQSPLNSRKDLADG